MAQVAVKLTISFNFKENYYCKRYIEISWVSLSILDEWNAVLHSVAKTMCVLQYSVVF